MKGSRRIWVSALVAVAVLAGLLAWFACNRPGGHTKSGGWQKTVQSMATNPVEFTKVRMTGGIGVLVHTNGTGYPIIVRVTVGSPAEKAGLKAKDIVTEVDGENTFGISMSRFADRVTGLTAGKVTLTIQRSGSTNLQCVVRRSSWNTLQSLSYDHNR